MLMAKEDPASAVEFLRAEAVKDENLIGMLLEAFVQLINRVSDAGRRGKVVEEALAIRVPDGWRMNVPVQITRARLAIVAGKEELFAGIMGDLASTRISRSEIEKLQAQWVEARSAR